MLGYVVYILNVLASEFHHFCCIYSIKCNFNLFFSEAVMQFWFEILFVFCQMKVMLVYPDMSYFCRN